ncbi:MAG: hypothetical protein U0228_15290 [Myxococcaceae bacterium]
MDPMFTYSVNAKFERPELAKEWVDWLQRGHLQAVIDAGAREAMLVQLGPLEFEARYRFTDEAAFRAYEAGPAVPLRAEGVAKFPPSRGVVMTRSLGPVLDEIKTR